jgi:hypothetical protein
MQENWDLIFSKYGAILLHHFIADILTLVSISALLDSNGTSDASWVCISIYAVCYDTLVD